ncbi:MmgE/PrpD family protein [Devosia sp. Root635]|uniref:MmgE/PrpD family protein n=1 Tax=Devosia sp. Root635 TaxID=1736575 RepID=UPI0006F92AD1|nr:MmgE/PrpD family protein [Devosia sp. Root635]KRA44845.1 hypothetical protein ASD80_06825 [Devosia sp. Root635]
MTAPTASQQIACFSTGFRPQSLSDQALDTVRRVCLDTIGVAVGGMNEPATILARDYAFGHSGPLNGTLWTTGQAMPVELAAFVNAIAGHVLDYDDVVVTMRGHPSVALLPPILALAEARNVSFEVLAAAYSVGLEVACKLGRAFAIDHYKRGWHATSSIGVIAATAGCSTLLGLDEEQTVHAVGLAVAQASGLHENFGTMAKSFQPGHCAAAAVRSVLLAQRGFTAAATALDGRAGYAKLYAEGADLSEQLSRLGDFPLEIEAGGVDIKQYPMCGGAHRALDGILDLRVEHGLVLDQVADIVVSGSNGGFTPLIHDRPVTGLTAKFSMQYGMAAALADGQIALSSFTDDMVMRPEIQAFFPHVSKVEAEGTLFPRWVNLDLRLKDGRRLEKRVTSLRGSAQMPLTDAALTAKIIDCCAFSGAGIDGACLAETLLSAQRTEAVGPLLARALGWPAATNGAEP